MSTAQGYKSSCATRPAPVRATSAGNLWIYFGSDSGFESRSTCYLDQVRVTLTRR